MASDTSHTLNLALQGGGSHGALTWGVLDALLEDDNLIFEGISGTSAGAMNAVVLAHGFAQAAAQEKKVDDARNLGRQLAREALKQLWEGVGSMGSVGKMFWAAPLPGSKQFMGVLNQFLSPYQTNPLNINPLRQLLTGVVDFETLANPEHPTAVPKLFICATNVRTGKGKIFTDKEVTADAVMASACLPQMFKAVEIDDESYWDGGFSGNPALYPLLYQTKSRDILLVQINPKESDVSPDTASEIMDRMNEITFNACLLAELRAIEFVVRLLEQKRLDPERYKHVLMHRIDGGAVLKPFGASSKSRADTAMLRQLFDLGRERGQQWLHDNREHLGVKQTLRFNENM
ncbi:patatin-like phospholipase family protein [Comamonas sp. Y33R10-2]|uniref:patatin-like phospholipase family protein n=1 Tax=Comamonas sp. Y33R10-2 TaxID=2853257 RepID=UPI001C5C8B6B|nr:patatin-like phospholipase family protein [Comamonas sp. Y33R10-2]QXZ09448.1 patatin-like phospholipase family protein [Comamonas sp. Y33R10-2]